MLSNEIIGIIILASVAVVIIFIYLCKCYSDWALSRHKENVRPSSLTDQDIKLLSVESRSDPLPYDPYNLENELSSKDHNDLEMVAMSIEQFSRKESYRKSIKGPSNRQCNKKKCTLKPAQSKQLNPVKKDHSISDVHIDIETDSIERPVAHASTSQRKEIIDAPVIVHNPPPTYDKVAGNNHIYATVQKSQPTAPDVAMDDAPTYFRPINPTMAKIDPVIPVSTKNVNKKIEGEVVHNGHDRKDHGTSLNNGRINGQIPVPDISDYSPEELPIPRATTPRKPKKAPLKVAGDPLLKPASKTSENIAPNKQDVEEDNLFFIPETATSPKESKRTRKKSLVTLDDITKPAKTGKKPKKGKTDGSGTPKTPKRAKKCSVPNDDVQPKRGSSEDGIDDVALKTDKTVTNTPYSGLRSPPIPPKPRVNPLLLSPQLQVRSSQL